MTILTHCTPQNVFINLILLHETLMNIKLQGQSHFKHQKSNTLETLLNYLLAASVILKKCVINLTFFLFRFESFEKFAFVLNPVIACVAVHATCTCAHICFIFSLLICVNLYMFEECKKAPSIMIIPICCHSSSSCHDQSLTSELLEKTYPHAEKVVSPGCNPSALGI